MSTDNKPKATPRDAVELARTAIQRVNELEDRVEQQQEIIDAQQEQIELLQAAIQEPREYDQFDKQTKIGMVQKHLMKRAYDQGGKAKMDYDDVKWEVFDGEPSPYHCYELMKQAAQEDGFDYQEPSDENKRLVVDLSEKRLSTSETELLRENKRAVPGGH